MSHKTINRESTISLFHQLMHPDGEIRVLRLVGEAKLGKSHLVTKIFPMLASEAYQARCAIIDLRGQGQTIPDIFHAICGLLGGGNEFSSYYDAYQQWIERPRVNVSGFQAFFARVDIHSESTSEEVRVAQYLTPALVGGLRNLADRQLLLIFDSVDDPNNKTSEWLMNVLLVHLAGLRHIRLIVAGRSVPEPSGTYAAVCKSHLLLPVLEEQAYVIFCRELGIGADLEDNMIRFMARIFDYKPGLFVDFVLPKFMHQEAGHD